MGWRDRLMRQVRAWWRESDRAPGWCLRVSQAPDETVEQAVARTARAQGLPPQAVLGALVLGFPESDQMRDWPRLFEWRRPGYQGPLRELRGYRQARIEMMNIVLAGPN